MSFNTPLNTEAINLFCRGISRYSSFLYRPNTSIKDHEKFRDALSPGQLSSKLHLLSLFNKLSLSSNNTLFIGHWHGLLPYWTLSAGLIQNGFGIEIDPHSIELAAHICEGLNWNSTLHNAEALSIEFLRDHSIDLIINTSCEHMSNQWLTNVPTNTRIIAQSNDYKISEHLFPQENLNSFKSFLNLSHVAHEDSQKYEIYNRFTVVGNK